MDFDDQIPHDDGTGMIDAVGEGVDPARIGERVWLFDTRLGRPTGTAAEYCACRPATPNRSLGTWTSRRARA